MQNKSAKRGTPRLPHERDQSDDSQASPPNRKMKQAHDDIASGQVDTDLHGQRGVEEVVKDKKNKKQKR